MGNAGDEAAEVLVSTKVDGRTARATRTRRLVVEAMVVLLEEGEVDPTAQQVADRAGVSLRTVFHHFQSMELVFSECWDFQVGRFWSHLRPVPAVRPLDERIEATVQQRTELFERIAGPRRAATVWFHRSEVLAQGLHQSHRTLRRLLAETFGPELEQDREPELLLDALDAATCFEAWDVLARERGQGAAAGALARSLRALLGTAPPAGTASRSTGNPTVQEDDRT